MEMSPEMHYYIYMLYLYYYIFILYVILSLTLFGRGLCVISVLIIDKLNFVNQDIQAFVINNHHIRFERKKSGHDVAAFTKLQKR